MHESRNVSMKDVATTAPNLMTLERQLAHAAPRGAHVVAALRIALSSLFLWAFFDKLLGLGFSTPAIRSWIAGGSPTLGFLSGSGGPFASFYHGIAGNAFIDALFMIALLAIGLALLLGIGLRVAAVSGITLMALMYTAALPPKTNPVVDDHVINALVLGLMPLFNAGRIWGLQAWWMGLKVIQRHRWLE